MMFPMLVIISFTIYSNKKSTILAPNCSFIFSGGAGGSDGGGAGGGNDDNNKSKPKAWSNFDPSGLERAAKAARQLDGARKYL